MNKITMDRHGLQHDGSPIAPTCSTCKDLESRLMLRSGQLSLIHSTSGTPQDLLNSSSKGCIACVLILRGIRIFENGWEKCGDSGQFQPLFMITLDPNTMTLKVWLFMQRMSVYLGMEKPRSLSEHAESMIDIAHLEFYSSNEHQTPWNAIGLAKTIHNDTSLNESWQTAKLWLNECFASHTDCRKHEPSKLPTRVLDVVGSLATDWEPFLYVTQGEFGNYICLSHCWGTHQLIQVTSANLTEMRRAIPLKSLPKTFGEAVAVTKYLGIRYLWIDSLCILQDSLTDWIEQAAEMGRIYQNSFLTIAASAATDATAGLFFALNHAEWGPFELEERLPNGDMAHLNVRLEIPHGQFRNLSIGGNPAHEIVNELPLLHRSWALQEHLLSPRVLQFGFFELVWECNQTIRCQCSVETAHGTGLKRQFTDAVRPADGRRAVVDNSGKSPWSPWYTVVSMYTFRLLTKSMDKLPALSGLAQIMQETYKTDYLAGLWRADIVNGICWGFSGDQQPTRLRSKPYRAPSWSWASIDDAITWHDRLEPEDIKVEVLSVECTLASKDKTGAVSGGHLTVKGFLATAQYKIGIENGRHIHEMWRGSDCVDFTPDVLWDSAISDELQDGEAVFCLKLGEAQKPTLPPENRITPFYSLLILRKCPYSPAKFERIGYMEAWQDVQKPSWFDPTATVLTIV